MVTAAGRPARNLDLVLHIGSGKTGTSSIQLLMGTNRDRLADHGWLYPATPSDPRHRHSRFGAFVQPDDQLMAGRAMRREQETTPSGFRRAFLRELVGELDTTGAPRVLLSDEALYGSSDEALRRVRSFTDRVAHTVRLVVYLRRQDDHLISRYQQVVKMGETRRLAERTQEIDFSAPYDYHARLTGWQQRVEPDAFVVRRFERDRFVDGSLYQDFLHAAGIDLAVEDLRPITTQNESLDAEAVEFLRVLNLHRVEHEGHRAGMINNRRYVVRLATAATGPVLTLPAAVLDEFMTLWEASNAAVARDFLGEEDGALFATDRRETDLTTEQVLDPARLDHYVELLELPERLHRSLRRIAEREAVRR